MELKDLNHDEKLALMGLEKVIIQADREFSEEEAAILQKLAKELGAEEFKGLVAEARERFKSLEDIKGFAKKVERQPARERIFECLYEMAVPGTVTEEEKRVLKWLAKTWGVTPKQKL